MAAPPGQGMYCKACKKSFTNWEAYFIHKIETKEHICCLFCGLDFKTVEGCRRHQQLTHAAEQNLECAGCRMPFIRVGSYISHIERKQCPVIHHSQFEARRAQKDETYGGHEGGVEVAGKAVVPIIISTVDKTIAQDDILAGITNTDGAPVWLEGEPKELSWEKWGDHDPPLAESSFPPLLKCHESLDVPSQVYRDGGSKVPDLLTGAPDGLNGKNLAWISTNEVSPYLLKPGTKNVATTEFLGSSDPAGGEFHPFDPDNPKFKVQDYYNPYTEKYRCPWAGCKKPQKTRAGFIAHLRSAAHMDLKLRCPQCLRQFSSATALVQHAESQAFSCKIRDTNEYRQAVDLLTAGFVDTAGRHRDETVRYVAPPTAVVSVSGGPEEALKKGIAAFSATQEVFHEDDIKRAIEGEQDW